MEDIDYINIKKYLLYKNISNNYRSEIVQFRLNLPDGCFIIQNLLRVLPNKRLVFLAKNNINNQKVIIKLFIHNYKYNKDYSLLLAGFSLLEQNNLLTPQILFYNINNTGKLAYIITEYIEATVAIINNDLHYQFTRAIFDLHRNFVYQADLHLNNFIVNNDKIYYLDCESIIFDKNLIKNRKAYDNFALFLAQLGIDYYNKWDDYINYYLDLLCSNPVIVKSFSGCGDRVVISNYIHKIAYKKLKQKINKFILKTARNSSSFIVEKFNNSYLLAKRNFYNFKQDFFPEFIVDPNRFIKKYTTRILKQGNTAHVYLIKYDNLQFVIKYYKPGNMFNIIINNIKYIFKKPRCLASWVNANMLESLNINTPAPLACVILKKYGLINQSFFIMKYSEDYKSLSDIETKEGFDKIFDKVNKLLFNFKLLKIAHRDFKTVNIGLIAGELAVLDLDAMKIYKDNLISSKLATRSNIKDLNRLLKCWRRFPWFNDTMLL